MKALLGIDEGSSAVKAALFDLDLKPLGSARREKQTATPKPGWVQQDGEEILAAVVDAVAELLDGVPDAEIVACGLDHQGESVLAWEAGSGRPLSPLVSWQDRRSQVVLDRLRDDEDEIRARSGLPLDPYFSAGKLAWLLENEVTAGPDVRLGNVDAFLSDRLGAGFATDPSTASRTQLGAPAWDPWLCERFGVPLSALPEIRDSAGDLGELRHERWRCPLPLRARVADQQAALAGSGCVVPGMVKATYGTGVFVLAHVGTERPQPDGGLLPTIAWRIDGQVDWALDGGVLTAGELLAWLTRDLGLAADPPALSALADTVADSGGVRLLPALAGLGAPWWRPEARALIAGLTSASRPAHIVRAALEAIAWRVADILDEVGEVDLVRVDGGLTHSATLLALQADAAGVAVAPGPADATVLGVALLAGVGAGLWTLQDAAARLPVGDPVRPQRDDQWRRAEHARWRAFVQAAAQL